MRRSELSDRINESARVDVFHQETVMCPRTNGNRLGVPTLGGFPFSVLIPSLGRSDCREEPFCRRSERRHVEGELRPRQQEMKRGPAARIVFCPESATVRIDD